MKGGLNLQPVRRQVCANIELESMSEGVSHADGAANDIKRRKKNLVIIQEMEVDESDRSSVEEH